MPDHYETVHRIPKPMLVISQRRVLFGCQVSLPSAEKPSPMSSHLRNNLDVDLERLVRRATLICRAAENES